MTRYKLKSKKPYLLTIIIVVFLSVFLVAISSMYFAYLRKTVEKDNQYYINELVSQMSNNVKDTVTNKFTFLETVEILLKNDYLTSYDRLKDITEDQRQNWNFKSLFLIDSKGNLINENNEIVDHIQNLKLYNNMKHRYSSISISTNPSVGEGIMFTMPIKNVTIDGTNYLGICAVYDLDVFKSILSVDVFNAKSTSTVFNAEGEIIFTTNPNINNLDINYFNYLISHSPKNEIEVEKLKNLAQNYQPGEIQIIEDGEKNYISFEPLNFENLYFSISVPYRVANAQFNLFMDSTIVFLMFVTLGGVALSIYIGYRHHITKKELERIAFIDSLTGTNSLQYFRLNLQNYFEENNSYQYAIVYTNVHQFRLINEEQGREYGDYILRLIKNVVTDDLSNTEMLGRIDSDHFIILVHYIDEIELPKRFKMWASEISERMREEAIHFSPPTLDFGVYIINEEDKNLIDYQVLIDRSKFVMNTKMKKCGPRAMYSIYNLRRDQSMVREKYLEDVMEDAIKESEFKVYLQPKVDVHTNQIVGAEALVRWITMKNEIISPVEFIPLFEKNGFIIELDLFVFEEVCKMIRKWIDEDKKVVKISINLSAHHFENINFMKDYEKIIEKYNVPSKYLEFEFTESAINEHVELISSIVKQIHDIGMTCSVDDFGSGYSSLNRIKDIQVDTLKIDRIFLLMNEENKQRGQSVIKSIIELARNLEMTTVVEGVENEEQLNMLKALNCDFIQGYYFYKPLAQEQFEEELNKKSCNQ